MKLSFPLAGQGVQQSSSAVPSRTALRSRALRPERAHRRWARAAHCRGRVQGGRRRHRRAGGHGHRDGPWPEPGAGPSPRPPPWDDTGARRALARPLLEGGDPQRRRGSDSPTAFPRPRPPEGKAHPNHRPNTEGNGEITRCHFLLESQRADR